MNDIEEITGEMRRLALRCKALEAKLADSVPKKTYNDAVAKMQMAIDGAQAELQRTKEALEKTETLGGRLNTLTNQISLLVEANNSQETALRGLEAKVSEATVPEEVYKQQVERCTHLEEEIKSMVPKQDFETLLQKNADLETRITTMVGGEDHRKAVEKISELEAVISNLIPRKDLEELSDQVKSIASSVPIVPAEEVMSVETPIVEPMADMTITEFSSTEPESSENAPAFQPEETSNLA